METDRIDAADAAMTKAEQVIAVLYHLHRDIAECTENHDEAAGARAFDLCTAAMDLAEELVTWIARIK